jgi:hypothetical protein
VDCEPASPVSPLELVFGASPDCCCAPAWPWVLELVSPLAPSEPQFCESSDSVGKGPSASLGVHSVSEDDSDSDPALPELLLVSLVSPALPLCCEDGDELPSELLLELVLAVGCDVLLLELLDWSVGIDGMLLELPPEVCGCCGNGDSWPPPDGVDGCGMRLELPPDDPDEELGVLGDELGDELGGELLGGLGCEGRDGVLSRQPPSTSAAAINPPRLIHH